MAYDSSYMTNYKLDQSIIGKERTAPTTQAMPLVGLAPWAAVGRPFCLTLPPHKRCGGNPGARRYARKQ